MVIQSKRKSYKKLLIVRTSFRGFNIHMSNYLKMFYLSRYVDGGSSSVSYNSDGVFGGGLGI